MSKYVGIKTNNLKNIDVEVVEKSITTIFGESGSGKSSLAYDTIAAISEFELGVLTKDLESIPNFVLDSYENVLMAVPLKQLNKNKNPHSTIATYFGAQRFLEIFASLKSSQPISLFKYNRNNFCKHCNGLGLVNDIDISRLFSKEVKISSNPFYCWKNSYQDFFKQLLIDFCKDNHIDINKTIKQLTKDELTTLLNCKSDKKYKIVYKQGNRKRVKTSYYYGASRFFRDKINESFGIDATKFSLSHLCDDCRGSRYSKNIDCIKLCDNLSFGSLFTSSFDILLSIFSNLLSKEQNRKIAFVEKQILSFVRNFVDFGLGYLTFSRSIPTLSGGELQRLRLSRVLNSELTNTLLILDEPSSSLSKYEIPNLIDKIKKLKEKNTLLIVEHNRSFKSISDFVYYLGPGAGFNGGYLISENDYEKSLTGNYLVKEFPSSSITDIELDSSFIKFNNKFKFHKNSFTCITGKSGCGKTTIIRDCLPKHLDSYLYISQSPLHGNIFSTVGTYTGITAEIKSLYEKHFSLHKGFFSKTGAAICSKCNGTGFSNRTFDLFEADMNTICQTCEGTGFNNNALSFKIDGLNIYDVLNSDISKLIKLDFALPNRTKKLLSILNRLGLGHLSLNRKITSLSGGENQRIKLALALNENKKEIIALDEPSKGMNSKNISDLVEVIYESIRSGKTIISVDHNEDFIKYASYVYEVSSSDNLISSVINK